MHLKKSWKANLSIPNFAERNIVCFVLKYCTILFCLTNFDLYCASLPPLQPTDLGVDILDHEVATLQKTMAESVSTIAPNVVDIIENKESGPSVTDPVVNEEPIVEVPETNHATDNNEVFPEKATEVEKTEGEGQKFILNSYNFMMSS